MLGNNISRLRLHMRQPPYSKFVLLVLLIENKVSAFKIGQFYSKMCFTIMCFSRSLMWHMTDCCIHEYIHNYNETFVSLNYTEEY